jgi:voltage-gated potassium channel
MRQKYRSLKHKVYILLHPELGESKADKIINFSIILLIILNIIAVILETVKEIQIKYETFFHYFDRISVIIFTIEYLLRVWSSDQDPKYKHSIKGRLKYMFTPGAIIDLIAFLPYYLHAIFLFDLRMLRILRLLRLLRLFRLTAYTKSYQLILNVFKSRFNELLLSFILTFFLIIIASCVVFFAEHEHNPDFSSIPTTLYWAVVTLTSTGYGDITPITSWGRLFTSFILLAGVAMLALPAGIITSGFLDEMKRLKESKTFNCPHCGKPIDQSHLPNDHNNHNNHHEK